MDILGVLQNHKENNENLMHLKIESVEGLPCFAVG